MPAARIGLLLSSAAAIMHILAKLLRIFWIPEYRETFLRTRVAASTEHDHVLGGLSVDTIVDIGANRGQFALCARRLFPTARIFAFEPLQAPAAVFRRVFIHDANVRLFNVAITSESGAASMHVSRWDGSSSLLPIAAAQNEHFPFTKESGRETVATARLADCLGEAELTGTALLKLDVQGFELVALEGCEPLLSRFKYVYAEGSFIELYVGQALAGELVAYVLSKNFELIGVANVSTGASKQPVQADFLFMRRALEKDPRE